MMGGTGNSAGQPFQFHGAGPKIFRYMMRRNNVATLEELLDATKALGIHLYACEMAMHILGLEKATSSMKWRMSWEWPLS